MIEEELNLNRESVQKILMDDLWIRKVCAKMVPTIFSEDQKQQTLQSVRVSYWSKKESQLLTILRIPQIYPPVSFDSFPG